MIVQTPLPTQYSGQDAIFRLQSSNNSDVVCTAKIYSGTDPSIETNLLYIDKAVKRPTPQNDFIFDFKSIISSLVDLQYPPPVISRRQNGLFYGQFSSFVGVYCAKFAFNTAPNAWLNSDSYKILLGNSNLSQPFGKILTLLTNQPQTQTTLPDQPQFMYIYADGLVDTLIKIRIDYADETVQNVSFPNISFENILCFETTFNKLFSGEPFALTRSAASIVSYEIFFELSSNSAIKSNTQKYLVDSRYYKQKRFIVFQNLRGGMDSIAITSETTVQIETERNIFKNENRIASVYYVDFEKGVESNFGYYLNTQLEYIQEIAISKFQYEFLFDKYFPIIPQNKKYEILPSKKGYYAIKYNWTYADELQSVFIANYIPQINPPNERENLSITLALGLVGFDFVTLNWTGSGLNGIEFEIYRSVNNISFIKIGQTSSLTFVDSGALASTTYYYKIKPLAMWDGEFSNTVTANTIAIPSLLAAPLLHPSSTFRRFDALYENRYIDIIVWYMDPLIVPAGINYQFQYKQLGDFDWITGQNLTIDFESETYLNAIQVFNVENFDPLQTWQYRARIYNPTPVSFISEWSEIVNSPQ